MAVYGARSLGAAVQWLWLGGWGGTDGWLVQRRRTRWDALQQRYATQLLALDAGTHSPEDQGRRTLGELAAARNRIALARPLRPTWIGDRFAGVEARVWAEYRVDLSFGWTRLWLVLPEETRAECATARAAFDASGGLAAWGVLYLALGCWWWPAAVIAPTLIVLAWRRGRQTAATWQRGWPWRTGNSRSTPRWVPASQPVRGRMPDVARSALERLRSRVESFEPGRSAAKEVLSREAMREVAEVLAQRVKEPPEDGTSGEFALGAEELRVIGWFCWHRGIFLNGDNETILAGVCFSLYFTIADRRPGPLPVPFDETQSAEEAWSYVDRTADACVSRAHRSDDLLAVEARILCTRIAMSRHGVQ
ncbi:hypothetical protein [Streptomyces sp. NPDC001275]